VFGQHRHGRIITMDPVGGQDMAADQIDERRQCGAARAPTQSAKVDTSSAMPSRA
jgi:hypothetical protein